jgi:hypothetical protein
MPDWIQLHEDHMDGAFEEVGFIRVKPEEFAARHGISFTERDQATARGPVSYAFLELRSGAQVFLQHEPRLSAPGIWVYARLGGDKGELCSELAAAFGIDEGAILPY